MGLEHYIQTYNLDLIAALIFATALIMQSIKYRRTRTNTEVLKEVNGEESPLYNYNLVIPFGVVAVVMIVVLGILRLFGK